MKLNTALTINDLDNEPLPHESKELTIKIVFEKLLSIEPFEHIKPLKAIAMAQRFHNGDVIDFDDGDISDLRQAIEGSKIWTPLVKGRVLQIFNNSKE